MYRNIKDYIEKVWFKFNTSKYVKLVAKDETHNGMTFREGLNIDPVPFQTDTPCAAGGIYFTKYDYFHKWFDSNHWYIYDVTIPDDAHTFIESGFKMKADKVILSNRRCIYDIPELWPDQSNLWQTAIISFLQQSGHSMRWVNGNKPVLVGKNEIALPYVNTQSSELYMTPVVQKIWVFLCITGIACYYAVR